MNMMPQVLYSPIWGYPIFAELGNEHSPLNSSPFFYHMTYVDMNLRCLP